jgi:predicted benzoate:H+ symporter BenE
MYLLNLNMNTKYALMLWLVLGWVTSQITKMQQSHIQKKSVFCSREGAFTHAKPTLHKELRPKLNSNQAILLAQPLILVPMALQYVIVKTKLKW